MGFEWLGNPALVPATNPWGTNDPTVGLNGPGTPGGILAVNQAGVPAAAERNIRSTINSKRVQITGASLSFPVNALTGMFVGSDNPLYYLYTTLRAENWTFWEPFRMQFRYNFIDSRYSGVGFQKTKDSIWIELQYLLY